MGREVPAAAQRQKVLLDRPNQKLVVLSPYPALIDSKESSELLQVP